MRTLSPSLAFTRSTRSAWMGRIEQLLGGFALACAFAIAGRAFSRVHAAEWQVEVRRCGSLERPEHRIDLALGGRPRHLRILREVLNVTEAQSILAAAKSAQMHAEEAGDNPVQSLCRILAEDSQWRPGDLAQMVRTAVEERVLPYMRQALSCDLATAQVVLRRYPPHGPRSHALHADHGAFGTAVMDLTPMPKSGLFVQCGDPLDLASSAGQPEAFFVPLGLGDVAVHGWDVWHGVALKEGQERFSLVVWACPSTKTPCQWYLEAAENGDTLAAYHLGIEAWRGHLKKGDLSTSRAFSWNRLMRAAFQRGWEDAQTRR
ncbi:unnamed protein product [Effrenium voratum]|nr:unnamed protein product [Effrenium voratum]CAJ1448446.1 unnamed protein product [Effrenium voratum]